MRAYAFIRQFFSLLFLILIITPLIGQGGQAIQRSYATQSYFNNFLPTVTGSGSPFGSPFEIRNRELQIENQVSALTTSIAIRPVRVEVVFHMLFTSDVNEAKQMAKDQLKYLNRDFNAINPPATHPNDPLGQYIRLATNPKIKFEKARIPETQQIGEGIATVRNAGKSWVTFDDMKDHTKSGVRPIQPDRYVNIWVVDLPDHLASYATSPYQNAHNAGIVIDHNFFATKTRGQHGFIEGKTLTHLVGNFLGLRDLWSEYGECVDDFVKDTPIHNSPNRGRPKYKHVTTCVKNRLVPEMTMNFMDSTDDSYQMMFTEGQVKRMHAFLQTARLGLITSSN